jgi:hypothetical protein
MHMVPGRVANTSADQSRHSSCEHLAFKLGTARTASVLAMQLSLDAIQEMSQVQRRSMGTER